MNGVSNGSCVPKDSDTARPLNKKWKDWKMPFCFKTTFSLRTIVWKIKTLGFPSCLFPNLSETFLKSLSKLLSINPCFSFVIEDLGTCKSFGMRSQKEFHEECRFPSNAMDTVFHEGWRTTCTWYYLTSCKEKAKEHAEGKMRHCIYYVWDYATASECKGKPKQQALCTADKKSFKKLPLTIWLVSGCQLVKHGAVHFHKRLQHIVD